MERSKQVIISHCYWIRERLGEKDAKSFSANIDIFQTMLDKIYSPRRGISIMTIFVIFGTLVFLFFCRENGVVVADTQSDSIQCLNFANMVDV